MPTRPVGYDGDTGRSNPVANPDPRELQKNRIRAAALVDYHYPEAYNQEPTGSIYSWSHLVFPDKPTGAGEMRAASESGTFSSTTEKAPAASTARASCIICSASAPRPTTR